MTVTTPGTSFKRNHTVCVLSCDRYFYSKLSGGSFQDVFLRCICFGRCCTLARKDVYSNPKVTRPRGHEHHRDPALQSRHFLMLCFTLSAGHASSPPGNRLNCVHQQEMKKRSWRRIYAIPTSQVPIAPCLLHWAVCLCCFFVLKISVIHFMFCPES